MDRIVYSTDDEQYRIREVPDEFVDMEYLKGDAFNPEHNPALSPYELAISELEFESQVEDEGVYGYILERFDGIEYRPVESCWGFVGPYSIRKPEFNHYIVDELKAQIVADTSRIVAVKNGLKLIKGGRK